MGKHRSSKERLRKREQLRRLTQRRALFETLEPRMVMDATYDAGGLRFFTTGSFQTTTVNLLRSDYNAFPQDLRVIANYIKSDCNDWQFKQTNDPLYVGFIPDRNLDKYYTPMLRLDSGGRIREIAACSSNQGGGGRDSGKDSGSKDSGSRSGNPGATFNYADFEVFGNLSMVTGAQAPIEGGNSGLGKNIKLVDGDKRFAFSMSGGPNGGVPKTGEFWALGDTRQPFAFGGSDFTASHVRLRRNGSNHILDVIGTGRFTNSGAITAAYQLSTDGSFRIVNSSSRGETLLLEGTGGLKVVPAAYDPQGKPLPFTFDVAKLKFQTESLNATLPEFGKFLFGGVASAPFEGGVIELNFGNPGSESLTLSNGVLELRNVTIGLASFKLGSVNFPADKLNLAVDAAANRLALTPKEDFTVRMADSVEMRLLKDGTSFTLLNGFLDSVNLKVASVKVDEITYLPDNSAPADQRLRSFYSRGDSRFGVVGRTAPIDVGGTSLQGINFSGSNASGLTIINGKLISFNFAIGSFKVGAGTFTGATLLEAPRPDVPASIEVPAMIATFRPGEGAKRIEKKESRVESDRYQDCKDDGKGRYCVTNFRNVTREVTVQVDNPDWVAPMFTITGGAELGGDANGQLPTFSEKTKIRLGGKDVTGLTMKGNRNDSGFTLGDFSAKVIADILARSSRFSHDKVLLAFTATDKRLVLRGLSGLSYDGKPVTAQLENFLLGDAAVNWNYKLLGELKLGHLKFKPAPAGLTAVLDKDGINSVSGEAGTTITGKSVDGRIVGARIKDGAFINSTPTVTYSFQYLLENQLNYSLGGVNFSGDSVGFFTGDRITMSFKSASKDSIALPQGTYNVEINGDKVVSAKQLPAAPVTIAGVTFENNPSLKDATSYTSDFNVADGKWDFKGKGKYFDKVVAIPGEGKVEFVGSELRLTNFTPPAVAVSVNGIVVDTGLLEKPTINGNSFTYKGRIALNVGASIFVVKVSEFTVTNGVVERFLSKVDSEFTVGGVKFSFDDLNFNYRKAQNAAEKNRLAITGTGRFNFNAGGQEIQVAIRFGDETNPGVLIENGQLQSLVVSATTNEFKLFGLTLAINNLGISYFRDRGEYGIYGSVRVSTPVVRGVRVLDNFTVSLGANADKPGIRIVQGRLDRLDVTLDGTINLYKLNFTTDNLRIVYEASHNQLQFTGGLQLKLFGDKFTAKVSLPEGGLLVNTQTGEVQVRGLEIQVSDVKISSAFRIENVKLSYIVDEQTGSTRIAGEGRLVLPKGLIVGAEFEIEDGALKKIGIDFETNPGIKIAGGVVEIYRIKGYVDGLNNLDKFEVKATIFASIGPRMTIGGNTYSLGEITGTILVNTNKLEISGTVELVGGFLGRGSAKATLTYGGVVKIELNATLEMYPGRILRGTLDFSMESNGNVKFKGTIGVFIPDKVPLIGGKEVGSIKVYLQIRPHEAAENTFAQLEATLLKIFEAKVKVDGRTYIDIEIDGPLFLDFKGGFYLRDNGEPGAPTLQIVSATPVAGTPNLQIVYAATTTQPEKTVVDLYVDDRPDGHQGSLIASSLPFQAGQQTFTWNDLAAFAIFPDNPNKPLYVYGVIRDEMHLPVFTSYSAAFVGPTGFLPAIHVPPPQSLDTGDFVAFSAAGGNPLRVDDPLLAVQPDSLVEVSVDVAAGTLFPGQYPDNVTILGAGTDHVVLQGTSAAINQALDGLVYIALPDWFFDDRLTLTVSRFNEANSAEFTAGVDLLVNPLTLDLEDGDAATFVADEGIAGEPLRDLELNDRTDGYLTGATIAITNYVAGQDELEFSTQDEAEVGLTGYFDPQNGVLHLTGFAFIDQFEDAFNRVQFTSHGGGSKSLVVRVADAGGDRGEVTIPITVNAVNEAPHVDGGESGLAFDPTAISTFVAPNLSITDRETDTIVRATVAFSPDTYLNGEDVLTFSGGAITGAFDSATGILTLTGDGTVAEYTAALRSVTYENQAATLTPGQRDVIVSVFDGTTTEEAIESALVRIAVDAAPVAYTGPSLTLTTTNGTLAADEALVEIDPDLTLDDPGIENLYGATVTIVAGYSPGEDYLDFFDLPVGVDAYFDIELGQLVLTGKATLDEYQSSLQSVFYVNESGDRSDAERTLEFEIFDGLRPGAPQQFTLQVSAAPFVELGLGAMVYTEGRSVMAVAPDLQLRYGSGDATLTGAVIAINGNFMTDEDRLEFTDQSGIQGSCDPETGVLELSGEASLADYQSALQSVQYRNTRANPLAGERIVSFHVFDGQVATDEALVLIDIDPEFVGTQMTLDTVAPETFIEHSAPTVIAAELTLADPDATTPDGFEPPQLYGAVVSIDNYMPGEDLLGFASQDSGIEIEFDAEQGLVRLTGVASLADYQAALRTVTYQNISEAPLEETREFRFALHDQAAGSRIDVETTSIHIQSLHESPTLAAGDAGDVVVLKNGLPTPLGLDDLQFMLPSAAQDELLFIPKNLPNALGQVLLADGTEVTVGRYYTLDELHGLTFDPSFGAVGETQFLFSIAATDPITGRLDPADLQQSLRITILDDDTSTDTERFVAQVFRDLLGHNPDPDALVDWAERLNAGAERLEMVLGLLRTRDFEVQQIDWLMHRLLDRPATDVEQQELLAVLADGTFQDVLAHIASSDEYFADRAADNLEQFVQALYQDVLGRDPEPNELVLIANLLAGGASRVSQAEFLILSDEGGRFITDVLCQRFLRRGATEDELLNLGGTPGVFGDAGSEGVMLQLLASDEYFNRYKTTEKPTDEAVADEIRRSNNPLTDEFSSVGMLSDIESAMGGAVLIAPQYVLTAAHLVDGIEAADLRVTFGLDEHSVTEINLHPDFSPTLLGQDGGHDLAILKLETPVVGIEPSRMFRAMPQIGEEVEFVGFGALETELVGSKRVGRTPIDSITSERIVWIFDNAEETTTTEGDSGSPVFVQRDGIDFVAAIVSGGSTPTGEFGDVASNTRVDTNLDWIESITGPLPLPPSTVNDQVPTDIQIDNLRITAGLPAGTLLGRLSAIDADEGQTFHYALVSGAGDTDNDKFATVDDELVTSQVLEITEGQTYSVRIRVLDDSGAFHDEVMTLQVRSAWRNPNNPLDASGDGELSPVDVLNVVNYVNEHGAILLPARTDDLMPFVDTNNDGYATPIDALLIINELDPNSGEGEGNRFDPESVAELDAFYAADGLICDEDGEVAIADDFATSKHLEDGVSQRLVAPVSPHLRSRKQ